MMYIKTKKAQAQKIKGQLISKGILAPDYAVLSEGEFVLFPVTKPGKMGVCERDTKPYAKQNLNGLLSKYLSKKELELVPSGFDAVGSIAIIELPELEKFGKIIGEAILKLNVNIKTVVAKASIHSGEFRLQEYRHLAGQKTLETLYKENSVVLKLDISKVYFSPRLATERLRVARQVKPGEIVLVMFSGCGPYSCVIAKNASPEKVVGVELNPEAHKYAVINKNLNKLDNVFPVLGDAAKILPNLGEKFDRILMPLPKIGENFLRDAIKVAKPGTMVHFYDFEREESFPKATIAKIKKNIKGVDIKESLCCGSFSPGVHRVCVDFVIRKN